MKSHNIISVILNSTVFSLISEHLELKSCEQSWSMWRPGKLTDGFLKVLQTCLLTSRWNTSNSLTGRTESQRIVGNAVMMGLEVNSSDTRDFLKTYTQSLSLFLLISPLVLSDRTEQSPRLSPAVAYRKTETQRASNCTSSCQRRHLTCKLYSVIRGSITARVKFTGPAGAQD